MASKGKQGVRQPASKFPHLQKKQQKNAGSAARKRNKKKKK